MTSARVNGTIVVLAKSPVPGRVKTRLCPPCTHHEAAALATAALEDTLDAVDATRAARRVVALDGPPGPWLREAFEVVAQAPGALGARLAAATTTVGGPVLVIGMDTPQVTAAMLDHAFDALLTPGVDAVLGLAADGGYWAIGLRSPNGSEFDRVPMSTSHTGATQRARLRALGLTVGELPELRDVDTFDDALAVAAAAPESRFAAGVRTMQMLAAP